MTNYRDRQDKLFKKSMLAMCIMAVATPALAQTQAKKTESLDDIEEIVVTGMKASLDSAQEIKRTADTVVDSITAEDLGSFPDKSVAEALQRVPGITVTRFAATTDTSHFSAEPSGVLIRGLPHVRGEFNGRDTFSANSSRGLSWGDISPELMAGVDTYKNQTAELIEGGIAGSINMRTRLPFDNEGESFAFTVSGNYGDLAESATPEASGIYTNRWQTDAGEFGVMANLAYSEVETKSQGAQLGRMNRYRNVYGDNTLYFLPQGVTVRDSDYHRERLGTSLAAQWQDNEGRFLATLQYNRSQYESTMEEYTMVASMGNPGYQQSVFWEITPGGAGSGSIVTPAEGTSPFTFFENGLLKTGTMVSPHGWFGGNNNDSKLMAANSNGDALVETCAGDWAGCGSEITTKGLDFGTAGGFSKNKNMTQDIALNFKWNVTDTLHANFDVQYVDATNDSNSLTTDFVSFADPEIDLSGALPSVVVHHPTNVNLLDAGQGVFANPNSYRINAIMDGLEQSEGNEFASRADFVFDVESGFIETIKAGIRYADREQNVNSALNWSNVANLWSNNAPWYNLDSGPFTGTFGETPYTFNGYPTDIYKLKSWDTSFGSMKTSDGTNLFVVPNIASMQNWAETMSATALGLPSGGWNPICSHLGARETEVGDTCFKPSDSLEVSEETQALYVQVNFGGSDLTIFDRPISGNIGVRYVQTDIVSSGGEQFPLIEDSRLVCEDATSEDPTNPPPIPKTLGCYLAADDIAFMNNGSSTGTSTATHHNVLPSLNLKYEITDKLQSRFAISRAMSRPDIGSLRNYISVSSNLPNQTDPFDPIWVKNSSGEITGTNIPYTATSANPFLKPTTADQIDLTLEYYFAAAGNISGAVFTKSFDDYIQSGRYYREMTNNGVTKTVEVNGPLNGDGAKLYGFEIQATRFFDFLPHPYDGLGTQINYTYIQNDGIKNSGINSSSSGGLGGSGEAPDTVEVDRLEGLSDDAYNFILMYEKNDWAARLAYSWRSEYLVTAVDCCLAVPIWSEDYGQWDASLRYKINDNLEVSFSGSNLFNEKTVVTQQVENSKDGGMRLPFASYQNDRRYTVTLRANF